MKSIAVFDLDNTIYNSHSFFGATKYLIDLGLVQKEAWDQIMEEYKRYKMKQQSYLVTANNLLKVFCNFLKGLDYDLILKKTQDFFELNKNNFYPYFERILPKLKQKYDVWLATTNFQVVAQVIKERYELDGFLCSHFEVKRGRFTGRVLSSLADGKSAARELVLKYNGETIAVGDSENDLGMFEMVKHPICINPSDGLVLIAKDKKWAIVNEDTIDDEILRIVA